MKKPLPKDCLYCTRRTTTCHTGCKEYEKYLEELARWNQTVLENKKKESEQYIIRKKGGDNNEY